MTGPAPELATPRATGPTGTAPRRALVGELVCPTCDAVVVRLVDLPEGVWLEAWLPQGPNPLGPPGLGFTMARPLHETDDFYGMATTTTVHCRRGHHVEIDIAVCRAMETAYRAKGRRQRQPGTFAPS